MRNILFYTLIFSIISSLSVVAMALPDLERAQAALDRGDRITAEKEFRVLAEFGLPSAQIMLGDLLNSGPPAGRRIKEALRWYVRAANRDSRGSARLASLYATDASLDPVEMDKVIDQLVKRYGRGERVLAGDIAGLLLARGSGHNHAEVKAWAERALLNNDIRGNVQLGSLCDVPLAKPEQPACAQKNYRAAAEYSIEAAGRLIASLQRHPESGSSAKTAGKMKNYFTAEDRYGIYRVYLKGVARMPQVGVAEALLRDLFNESTKAVHTSSAQARELADPEDINGNYDVYDPTDAAIELASAYAKNVGEESRKKFFALLPYLHRVRPLEVALLEADAFIDGNLVPAHPARAEKILLPWAERAPAAAFMLGNLYKAGFLDEADHLAASRYYQLAGKGGMGQAWYALTRLYLSSPSFQPDPVRAEKYADLARKAGFLQVDFLLESSPVIQGAL